MKLPSTKLNIGDSLWSMSSDKPVEWRVEAIRCFVTGRSCSISYDLYKANTAMFKTSISEASIGSNYFASKQELMVNLFSDCLIKELIVK